MKTLMDGLYNAWIIGTKDILDVLKNKSSRSNLIVMVGMVVFFYWLSGPRPLDKGVSVVVYDEGNTSLALETVKLGDGAEYSFRQASSLQEMEQKMAYQNLGLVLPADFDQVLASRGMPTLSGYIFWVDREKVAELETKYSQAFSEILGQPVQVVIGQNIVIPRADADGNQTSVTYLMIYFVFTTALLLIPHLMLEEKQTRTLDALLTSPASPGQVVLGKALAGFFYILVTGGLGMILFAGYIVNWALALAAFLGYALLAIGLGLAVGSFIKSMKQSGIWMVVLMLFLMIPPLFYMESNLKAGIRVVLTWLPSSALASLFRFACSTGVTPAQLWPNLAIAVVSIAAVFGLVIWKVRRSDR
jgi:ABC-type transport system involved in multi-copper enzyme maturation permease subunit